MKSFLKKLLKLDLIILSCYISLIFAQTRYPLPHFKTFPQPIGFSNIQSGGDLGIRLEKNFNGLEDQIYQPDTAFEMSSTCPGDYIGRLVLALTLSSISEKTLQKVKLKQSIKKIKNLIKGLKFNYYENNDNHWSTLQDFNYLMSVYSGLTGDINLNPAKRDSDFGLTFSGFILIKQNGVYTFYLNSDDGSNLYIGDTLLIDNNDVHGMIEKSGEIALSQGYYPIRINYFQGISDKGLDVEMEGPNIKEGEIKKDLLFSKKNSRRMN